MGDLDHEIHAEFRRLEARLAEAHPAGLVVLRLYEAYEPVLRWAEACCAALRAAPRIFTSDSTGGGRSIGFGSRSAQPPA